jgi:hypothetical protein
VKAVLEFTGYFRMKTGRENFEAGFDDEKATIFDLIVHAENLLADCHFKVLDGTKLKDGVLVFFRNDNDGLERIFDLSVQLSEVDGHVIMANLMGGG